jgi:NAD(P)H-dependent FMN reductase
VADPVLQIIIASTRPGRIGLPVAQWFEQAAIEHGGFDVELVDLAEVNLPFFDEPSHPRLRQYVHQHTKDWSEIIDRGDAYVFVTPEYNYGFNAVLKNAIDFLHQEWVHKPVGFVSYGGVSGGTRGVVALDQVIAPLGMLKVGANVELSFGGRQVVDGVFVPGEKESAIIDKELNELLDLSEVLKPSRLKG